ncbi:MAG: HD domain-containing phosphohydrolase [Betaproteobacteria bacterium]
MTIPLDWPALKDDIDRLAAAQSVPSTADTDANATRLAQVFMALPVDTPAAEREIAVTGLLAAQRQRYRTGHLLHCERMLAAALQLSAGLDARTEVSVLLRCANFGLLQFDIGAALDHTAAAIELARAEGLRLEEAYAAADYGYALHCAGLYRQADTCYKEALVLASSLENAGPSSTPDSPSTDNPHLCGNIWALRFGALLELDELDAAEDACEQTLLWAAKSSPMVRDTMSCTAWCNRAVLYILRGETDKARNCLQLAGALPNLGLRPRWLIGAIAAMADIRDENSEAHRRALDEMLLSDRAPARTYVIETYSIMAQLFSRIGDSVHAHDALTRLSSERVGALAVLMRGPELMRTTLSAERRVVAHDRFVAPEATLLRLERLAVTAELRDDTTGRHCFRVGRLSLLLARRAGLPAALLADIDVAARLHDIGKIAIPDAILLKPGKLTADEMRLMQTHTTIGADLLQGGDVPLLHAAEQIARYHHEHWNGAGYPHGLAGEAIPLAARVAALADVYDALTHARPYKHAWPREEALAFISDMRGRQFDPVLTDVMLAMMREAANDWDAFSLILEGPANESLFVSGQARAAQSLEDDAVRQKDVIALSTRVR